MKKTLTQTGTTDQLARNRERDAETDRYHADRERSRPSDKGEQDMTIRKALVGLKHLLPFIQSESPSDMEDRDQMQEDHLAVNGQDVNMQQEEELSGDQSMEAVEDLDAEVEDRDDSGQTDVSLD